MPILHRLLIAGAVLFVLPLAFGQASESAISDQLSKLRSLSKEQRPVATIKVANDIQSLPAGKSKLRLADSLAHLVTEGDQGQEALQAVADALSKSLAETPVPAKGKQPPMPYMDLATLVRYEHVSTTLNDPLFAQASDTLAANDAEIEKADFTLKDMHNKKWTLSQLRGKIVLVNFWATWCAPCQAEMPDLDIIYTHYESQGLVVLSITDELAFKVSGFLSKWNYHPPVLLDFGGEVHKLYHITGIPRTYVFNREGKLTGVGIDQCTQRQFLDLLSQAGLKPQ